MILRLCRGDVTLDKKKKLFYVARGTYTGLFPDSDLFVLVKMLGAVPEESISLTTCVISLLQTYSDNLDRTINTQG